MKTYPIHGKYTRGVGETHEWDGTITLNTEQRVNKVCRKELEDLGYRRNGQRAKVCVGRHLDRIGNVETINWESGEVFLKFVPVKGLSSERWFKAKDILLLDPDFTPVKNPLEGLVINKAPRITKKEEIKEKKSVPVVIGWVPKKKG